MPNFKPKTIKKIKYNKKVSVTLDSKHKEILNDFSKDENNIIPELQFEKYELKKKLEMNEITIEDKLDINDRIEEINKNIKDIKNKKKEYFLENSKLIFDYFENKKNISNIKDDNLVVNKNNLVKSFFKINDESDNINNNNKQMKNNNISQKYLSNIDVSFLDVNSFICQSDICKYCYKGELIPIEDEGILICNSCFRNIPYLIENEKPSYKEPPKEVCFYAYKRINHFKEILAQFQGKETTQIPIEVIENIRLQIKKERIELYQITNNKTK